VFAFAWSKGMDSTILAVCGLVLGVIFAPILHELGHVIFAKAAGMDCVLVKCFCFQVRLKEGKKRFSFASPFAPDRTEVVPKFGGNMRKRAAAYTLGGLILSAVSLSAILGVAIPLSVMGKTSYLLWGLLPYIGYLFLLNVAPMEYGRGKTDMLIYYGLCKGAPTEKCSFQRWKYKEDCTLGKAFRR
jgi:hypothetical protein